jgi:hypothetical protein
LTTTCNPAEHARSTTSDQISVWLLRADRRNRVTSVIRYPTNTTIFRCQTAGRLRPPKRTADRRHRRVERVAVCETSDKPVALSCQTRRSAYSLLR